MTSLGASGYRLPSSTYRRAGFVRLLRSLLLIGWGVIVWYFSALAYDLIHLTPTTLKDVGTVLTEHILPFPFLTETFRPWAAVIVVSLCLVLLGGGIWAVLDFRAEQLAFRRRRLYVVSLCLWLLFLVLVLSLTLYALYADVDLELFGDLLRALALVLGGTGGVAGAGVLIWQGFFAAPTRIGPESQTSSVFPKENDSNVPVGGGGVTSVTLGGATDLGIQYHAYTAMVDTTQSLRQAINLFYTALLTVLVLFLLVVMGSSLISHARTFVVCAAAVLGFLLSLAWASASRARRLLSGAQFEVLREMETALPAQSRQAEFSRLRLFGTSRLDGAFTRPGSLPLVFGV